MGEDLALPDLPVMTEHSSLKWRSIRMLGSCPGGIAIGTLHKGPIQIVNQDLYEREWGLVRTRWGDPVVLALVILIALVGGR